MVGKIEKIESILLFLVYDSDIMQVDRLAGNISQSRGCRLNDRYVRGKNGRSSGCLY